MIQYAMVVVATSLADYVHEESAKRRELTALLEQGFSIVSVTATHQSQEAVSLVITLQAPLAVSYPN